MACYISTRQSRYYAALETAYGKASPVTAASRFTALWLNVRQQWDEPRRRDKTGTRTNQGVAGRLRKRTRFDLSTYVFARESGTTPPRIGPLVQAGLGAAPRTSAASLPVAQVQGTEVVFGAPHGLLPGDAMSFDGELRFVTACPDAQTAWLSAPLSANPGPAAAGAVSYGLSLQLPSVSLYEYWSPATAVQRVLRGCVVDEVEIVLNGDFHEVTFRGEAAGVSDSKSFEAGEGGLENFPPEPELEELMELPVPGHVGQVWIGATPQAVSTVASARIRIMNHAEMRWRDFGLMEAKCVVPGEREVSIDLEVYSNDADIFGEIYASASRHEPMPLTVQMGETPGAMCGIHVANFIPAVPEFLDGEERLRWRLRGCPARGYREDEIHVAFG
jgi:hypothetical protein